MLMSDGIELCNRCNVMSPDSPDTALELFPGFTAGPAGPERFEAESYHVCRNCLRRAFAADLAADLRRQRERQRRWRAAEYERPRRAGIDGSVAGNAERDGAA